MCNVATLTLCVRKSLCSDFPLDQHSEEGQHRPHSHDDPSKPAHWFLRRHLQRLHCFSLMIHLDKVLNYKSIQSTVTDLQLKNVAFVSFSKPL